MKDKYDKLKIVSEVLKNNWPILALAFTAFSSMATNASQFITNQDLEVEQELSHNQIAEIARHYATKKKVTPNCDKCLYEVRKLREEFH